MVAAQSGWIFEPPAPTRRLRLIPGDSRRIGNRPATRTGRNRGWTGRRAASAGTLENHVTGHRASNHLAVLTDLRIGARRAPPGLSGATHTCERNTGHGSVEVLDRELKVGRSGALGENFVNGQSGGCVEKRGEKSAVHCPTLVAVFG